MYPFVHHPDVAHINGVPVGYVKNPVAIPQFRAAHLQPRWGGRPDRIRQDVSRGLNPPFFSPRHRSAIPYDHLIGHAYTYGGAGAGCPGQIMCADGRCVDTVTACDDERAAPASRGAGQLGPPLRRRRRRRRALRNPTFADYVLGAFGFPGMPAYRSKRRR